MSEILTTIITPTTGRSGLFKLIESIEKQKIPYVHLLLWDDKRDGSFLYPDPKTLEVLNPLNITKFCYTSPGSIRYSIVIPGSTVQGSASGSSLRSVGLMAAQTPYITFADDDCWFEDGHLESLLDAVENHEWAYCRRKIWASESEYIGIDDFESVGNSPNRKVPYEMVDNNCMIFKRRLGSSGAVLYRTTQDYNDDRLFYAFLKQYGGTPGKTNKATVNQICPQRLIPMFKENCTKE